ncbi:unnamed protein product [Arctogadus glacialis]
MTEADDDIPANKGHVSVDTGRTYERPPPPGQGGVTWGRVVVVVPSPGARGSRKGEGRYRCEFVCERPLVVVEGDGGVDNGVGTVAELPGL